MKYRPSKNVFLLGITSFFNDFSSEMVLSVFPAFFVSVLKAGASSLGLVEGLADGASNIIKIYSGRLSDRLRKRKPFIIAGYSLSVFTRPVYLLVSSVVGVIGLRFTDRVGKGLRDGPRDAIISLSTPPDQIGQAFGYHRMWDTFGAIAGPFTAYLILRAYPEGFHYVFLTAFFIGFLAIISLLFVKDVVDGIKKNHITLASVSLFSPQFKRYLVALFFLSLGNLPLAVLLLKTQSLGMALATIPLFYMVYNLSYAGFSLTAGRMSDRIGAKIVIIVGYAVLLASYALLGIAGNTLFLISAFLVLGLFPALTDGVQRAFASELSSEEHRAGALGLVNAITGFGLLFSGIIGGYIWQYFGTTYAFVIAGCFVLSGIGILLFIKKTVQPN